MQETTEITGDYISERNIYQFKKAKAIWKECIFEKYNQFIGFHGRVNINRKMPVKIAIAARSYYRLFINGEMISCGPARTAEHYCRVDEIIVELEGNCDIAVEVLAYSKTEKYCNDCTMEPGMLIVEILNQAGDVILATGEGDWTCQELTYKRAIVETMSHCRGILEYYDLTPNSYSWRKIKLSDSPIILNEDVTYIKRRAPYATYRTIPFKTLKMIGDVHQIKNNRVDSNILLPRLVNPKWYALIPEANLFLKDLLEETEEYFTGYYVYKRNEKCNRQTLQITPGEHPTALVFEMEKSEVGFIDFSVSVSEPCIIDIVNSDFIQDSGKMSNNTYVTRYSLQQGEYHLTGFEPKLTRYVKLILRTKGKVELLTPVLLDDTYPDDNYTYFQCDDGELNRIYEASRRTLRLNTLDIFMDCPERERGGWLCDSYFTAQGAWQLFGDLSVEKDFLENFMLTDASQRWKGFFPEVYPGIRGESHEIGIRNWSFWLLLELCDYYERSGDFKFIKQCQKRVECFIEGLLSLRGQSGLLEDIGTQFVDWSLSNKSFALEPISIPINCLAVCMLERVATLYGRMEWEVAAQEMRNVIEALDSENSFNSNGDNAFIVEEQGNMPQTRLQKSRLKRGDFQTESGIALEIWSGFHVNDKQYLRKFVENMGSCPKYRSDPNIGKSNLFIGLMIRFDVLSRTGKIDTLIRELKDLYLEELKIGPGTLFEGISQYSGCHGFNGYIGKLIVNNVLGLGIPLQQSKTVKITPHPGELKWAGGRAYCEDGEIFLCWAADPESHVLDMMLRLPDGWKVEYDMPFELRGWTIKVNGGTIDGI